MQSSSHFLRSIVFIALFLFWNGAQASTFQIPTIQVVPIEDSATGREYELYIKLPEDYDPDSEKKHPVIYITDARWHIEIISGSIEYLVKDAILVGVSWEKAIPPQQSRMRDYMPTRYTGEDYPHATGEAEQHLTFIKEDVFKYIESSYNTDPAIRSYYGYSASGTFGTYILLTQPDTFKNYMIGSPATLFDDYKLHEYEPFQKLIPKTINANVYISVGSDEKADNVEHAIGLVQFLKSKKTTDSSLEFNVVESADHGSAFPISAVQSLYWLAKAID